MVTDNHNRSLVSSINQTDNHDITVESGVKHHIPNPNLLHIYDDVKTVIDYVDISYLLSSNVMLKCSTKHLSKLLTCFLSTVNTELQNYCDTSYSRGGVNQMWILKNSKDLLEHIQSLSSCNSIKTFDFSTLYTTIPHSKLNDKLREFVQLCFIKKNGKRSYKYLVLGRDRSCFVKHHSDSTKKFSETDICNILEFLIDNIFVMFGGRVFQQTVGIPMGTNCAPLLLADLFLYSYEADFIQGLLKKNEKKIARSFNFTFRYIDDVLSLNNSRFVDFVDRIYPIELEIKDTTYIKIDLLHTLTYTSKSTVRVG